MLIVDTLFEISPTSPFVNSYPIVSRWVMEFVLAAVERVPALAISEKWYRSFDCLIVRHDLQTPAIIRTDRHRPSSHNTNQTLIYKMYRIQSLSWNGLEWQVSLLAKLRIFRSHT